MSERLRGGREIAPDPERVGDEGLHPAEQAQAPVRTGDVLGDAHGEPCQPQSLVRPIGRRGFGSQAQPLRQGPCSLVAQQ